MNKRDYHSEVEHITDAEQAEIDSVKAAMTTSDDQREAATRTQPGTPERSALIEAAA